MKKLFLPICSFFFSLGLVSAQTGKVLESLSMKSKILGEEVKYTIYLPADYDQSTRRYPVVYLLHGYSDDETAWIQFGETHLTVDKGVANREIPPMIIVMPDAKVTFYMNDVAGKTRYEDMFIQELIPFIDATYRTRSKKEFRALAGLSMGGYGSLLYAMHHPDLFAACVAFSSAVWDDEEMIKMPDDQYDGFFAKLFGPGKGQERVNSEKWKTHSPIQIVKNGDKEKLKTVRYWIDCGDDDFLAIGNAMLHRAMREEGIPHEYRVRDGGHTWSYWRDNLAEGLRFIAQSFHR